MKNKIKIYNIAGLALIIVGFLAILFFLGGGGDDSCEQKKAEVKERVSRQEKILSELTIVKGKKTEAESTISGDCLTGPSEQVKAFFDTDKKLGVLEGEVYSNLKKQGFRRDGAEDSPNYSSSTNSLKLRYIDSNSKILYVIYAFDKDYSCPNGKICHKTDKNKDQKNIHEISNYSDLIVNKVTVFYTERLTSEFLW